MALGTLGVTALLFGVLLTEPVSVWINRYTGVNAFEYLPGSQYYRVYRAYEPNYYHNAINALTIPL